MADPSVNIRLLDKSPVVQGLDLVSEVFHRINRIIPQDQIVFSVSPGCRVRDAISQMRQYGYSQIPVVEGGEVLGVFSYRSFAQQAATATLDELNRQRCALGDLSVDEFLEQFEFARVTDEMSRVSEVMEKDNGVLIGASDRLVGILTPTDFLKYLYQVASPFVMVSEIELAVRALIRIALKRDRILAVSKQLLKVVYGGEHKVPSTLEDMTFANYKTIICHGETWPQFELVLGGNMNRTAGKLKEVGDLRNDLFHFKREITVDDHQTLAGHRNWFLSKVRQTEARRRMEVKS